VGGENRFHPRFFLFSLFYFFRNIIQHFHFPRRPQSKEEARILYVSAEDHGELGTQPPFLLPIQEQKHIDEENAHLINSRMEKMRMVGVVRDFISSLVSIDRLYMHTRRAAGDIKEESLI
jgi:hypothetical protein